MVIIPCDLEHDDSNPVHVALLEAGKEIERLRKMVQSSYALRPEDTLVINVPMHTDPEVCRYLAENVPEHIKGRVVVVRSGS